MMRRFTDLAAKCKAVQSMVCREAKINKVATISRSMLTFSVMLGFALAFSKASMTSLYPFCVASMREVRPSCIPHDYTYAYTHNLNWLSSFCGHTHTDTQTHTDTDTHTHRHTHTHTDTRTHTHTHTHTHTYTYLVLGISFSSSSDQLHHC